MNQTVAVRSRLISLAAFFCGAIHAWAAAPSPVGRWQTVDEDTGQPRSIVRLELKNNELEGTIERVFLRPDESDRCIECTGALKDKPITGLRFLWGLKADGDEYAGGEVLDPDNGKIYRCHLRVSADGRTIVVRGYLGISLFGRTVVWRREP